MFDNNKNMEFIPKTNYFISRKHSETYVEHCLLCIELDGRQWNCIVYILKSLNDSWQFSVGDSSSWAAQTSDRRSLQIQCSWMWQLCSWVWNATILKNTRNSLAQLKWWSERPIWRINLMIWMIEPTINSPLMLTFAGYSNSTASESKRNHSWHNFRSEVAFTSARLASVWNRNTLVSMISYIPKRHFDFSSYRKTNVFWEM